jgi:hypothetical protein
MNFDPAKLENVIAKVLDGATGFCQTEHCGKPAFYLFSASSPDRWCMAFCETHAGKFAERIRLSLRPANEPWTERRTKAVA